MAKFQIQSNDGINAAFALINYYLNTGDDHETGYFSE